MFGGNDGEPLAAQLERWMPLGGRCEAAGQKETRLIRWSLRRRLTSA
jgi:hypothetical protein